jgi:hypothetical protein
MSVRNQPKIHEANRRPKIDFDVEKMMEDLDKL